MTARESRLHRKLLPEDMTAPLFSLRFHGWMTHGDDSIQSITINRGLGGPGGGVAVTTMEVDVIGDIRQTQLTGVEAHLKFTNPLRLRRITGNRIAEAQFVDRFRGRVGPITVTDNGNGAIDSTKFTCSSWISQEAFSGRRRTLTNPTYVNDAVQQLMYGEGRRFTMSRHGDRDTLVETIEGTTYSDSINKLTEEYEILIGDLRNGDARFMYLPWRVAQAVERISTQAPVMRSQVLAPASWEQPNETHATQYYIVMTNADGDLTGTTRYSESTLAPAAGTREIDWSHFMTNTNHWDFASRAIIYRETTNHFSIPSLKVDLLALLTSESAYDRRVAGEMLVAETGDTLNLSGDWPAIIAGVYVITGMTERISPDEWSIEVSLSSAAEALGATTPEVPEIITVPPLVWDQAQRHRWDLDPRRWNH